MPTASSSLRTNCPTSPKGNPTLLATVYASEQLDIPFDYHGFTTVDTNAVRLMWARGDINSTVRSSLWYRFPVENPDWIPSGLMRLMAGMGPRHAAWKCADRAALWRRT